MLPGNDVSETQDCALSSSAAARAGSCSPSSSAGAAFQSSCSRRRPRRRGSRRPTPPRPAPWNTTGGWVLPKRCAPRACRRTTPPTLPISPATADTNSPASACRRRARARDRPDAHRLVERGRAAAPRLADVRRGCVAGRSGGMPDGVDPAGWRMIAVRDTGGGVEVDAEHGGGRTTLRAAYAMGADGGSSPTRKALGYGYVGESGVIRDFMGGRMFAIHFRSTRLYDVIPHPRAWMYWAVNRERRAFMATVNGRDQFNFHTQLRPDQRRSRSPTRKPRRCSRRRWPRRSTSRSSRARRGPPATRWWRRNSSAPHLPGR